MKKLLKYTLRAVLGMGTALVLTIMDCGVNLPVNILTMASTIFLGVPGIALSIVLCNRVFA